MNQYNNRSDNWMPVLLLVAFFIVSLAVLISLNSPSALTSNEITVPKLPYVTVTCHTPTNTDLVLQVPFATRKGKDIYIRQATSQFTIPDPNKECSIIY